MTALALAAALAFTPADARLAHETARELVERHTPRDSGTAGGAAAANFLLDAASAAGADVAIDRFGAMTPRGWRTFTNLEGRYVADRSADWVVLVAHYDTKTGVDCPGANDGASASGLLVALAGAFCERRPKGLNAMFIWTDGEECFEAYGDGDGFWGSKRAARRLKESGRKVRAVVCLDMLGDRDLNIVVPRNGTPSLRRMALEAARDAGLGHKVSPTRDLVKDDHVPFLREGFAAVDLIDFDYGSAPGLNDYWHTPHDTMDKVSEKSLEESGRLVVRLIGRVMDFQPATAGENNKTKGSRP